MMRNRDRRGAARLDWSSLTIRQISDLTGFCQSPETWYDQVPLFLEVGLQQSPVTVL